MKTPASHPKPLSPKTLYALDQFEGTLVFISHDVYFIRALADHVVHVHSGRLTHYPGDYQYYLDKTKALSARAALTAGGGEAAPRNAAARPALDRKEQKRLEESHRPMDDGTLCGVTCEQPSRSLASTCSRSPRTSEACSMVMP